MDHEMDGNKAQVRMIAEQLAAAFGRGVDEERHLLAEVDLRIKTQVDAAVDRVKLWVLGSVVTQLIGLVPVIFFLGGIYSTNTATLDLIKEQQVAMKNRGEWMNELERRQTSVEQWAKPKGYEPPTYRSPTQ